MLFVYQKDLQPIPESELENINGNTGEITEEQVAVEYRYVVESPEDGEWVVVKEYPETGGKDVEWKVTSEEVGHWEMIDRESGKVLDYPIQVDISGLPKDQITPDILELAIYRPYTQEEIEANEKAEREIIEMQETMEKLPGRVDEIEGAQDDIVLLLADIVGGAM